MTRIKSQIWLIALVLSLAVMGGIGVYAGSGAQQAQDAERTLGIERYPNEPLELVDLRIGEQSVKRNVKIGPRYKGIGRDSVKFKEKNAWFKSVKVRLRNVSGRPIYGLRAGLLFEHPSQKMLFSLLLSWAKNLKREPLQPNDEIALEVTDQLLNRALKRMRQYGVEADGMAVSLSVDDAYFGDDLMWSKGSLLRRDPNNPYQWRVVDKPVPSGVSQLKRQADFKSVSFKPVAPGAQLSRCQAQQGGFNGYQCSGDYDFCLSIEELGNGAPGNLSAVPEEGDCERQGVSCLMETTHYRLRVDSTCPPPCQDRDGDGYRDVACGGNDCNDDP